MIMKKINSNNIRKIGELPIPYWHRICKAIITGNGICTCIVSQSNNSLQKVLIIKKETNNVCNSR